MACTTFQKMTFQSGCRLWDTTAEVPPNINYTEPVGPFLPSTDNQSEFAPIKFVTTTVSNAAKSVSRLIGANKDVVVQQADTPWYDFTGRISKAASATNDALQSTMIKVIVLVLIVGALAVFGMSYVQAKGVSLAK